MSSRALKKLQRQQLEEAEDDNEAEFSQAPAKVNAFALLGGEEDDAESSQEEVVEVEETKKPEPKPQPKKKNKKKNKKKKPLIVDSDDELDKILADLALKEGHKPQKIQEVSDDEFLDTVEQPADYPDSSYYYFTVKKMLRACPLLAVNPRDLDPDQEYRNLFGTLSEEAVEDADATSSTFVSPDVLKQIKKMGRSVRGWGGKDRRSIPGTTRKLSLTKIRDDWIPTLTKQVTQQELTFNEVCDYNQRKTPDWWMDAIKSETEQLLQGGIKFFRFKDNVETKIDNARFYISMAVTPDHESLIQLLNKSPYHVETILQVSTILLRQGDKQNSSGLVERALFVFDRALKSNFELGSPLMRLPFEYFLNRQFYLTLFRYIQVLTSRSTFYTALQYCKLLWSLSPAEDPYGVRYFIDFYAVMSGEYDYLIDLCNSPLVSTYKVWATPSLLFSKSLSFFCKGDKQEASASLKEAAEQHPYTASRLLEVFGAGQECDSSWCTTEMEVATQAYLVRSKIMYDTSEKVDFLVNGIQQFLDVKKDPIDKREQLIPINLVRHVVLSGESSVMARIPASFWDQNEVFEYDVLPPQNDVCELFTDWVDDEYVAAAMQGRAEDEELMEAIRQSILQQQAAQVE